MEWNIGAAPLLYASQTSDGLHADYLYKSEGATFTFTGVRVINANRYAIAASNAAGPLNGPSVMMVPEIAGQPQSQTVVGGGFASFSVSATGTEPLTYEWLKNGSAILGGNSSTLTLNNVQATDAGQYSVVVSNDAGSAESFPAMLTVNITLTPPMIAGQPQDQTTIIGGLASFSVLAISTEPLTYQWLKNGFNIPGETSSTLTLNNVQTTDAGQYSVVVSNTDGPVTSNPANLQILIAIAPIFENLMWSQTTGFSMALRGQSQTAYRIQMSTNLINWLDLTNFTASGVMTQILDPDASNAQQRFYRAMVENSGNIH